MDARQGVSASGVPRRGARFCAEVYARRPCGAGRGPAAVDLVHDFAIYLYHILPEPSCGHLDVERIRESDIAVIVRVSTPTWKTAIPLARHGVGLRMYP